MNRVRAMMLSTVTLVVAGCGMNEYEKRMSDKLTQMKEDQKLNTYTEEPVQGKVKGLNVYLRPPKGAVEESGLQLSQAPGMFDFGTSYTITPKAPTVKEGETPPILPPMKMHVLIRQKAKKAPPKKGETAPAADPAATPPANRGEFRGDVRAILAADYGGDVAEKPPTKVTKGKTAFERFLFTATTGPSSGNTIEAYLANGDKGDLQAALIFDFAPSIKTNTIISDGQDLCLKHFALGSKARGAFAPKAEKGGDAAAGPAF